MRNEFTTCLIQIELFKMIINIICVQESYDTIRYYCAYASLLTSAEIQMENIYTLNCNYLKIMYHTTNVIIFSFTSFLLPLGFYRWNVKQTLREKLSWNIKYVIVNGIGKPLWGKESFGRRRTRIPYLFQFIWENLLFRQRQEIGYYIIPLNMCILFDWGMQRECQVLFGIRFHQNHSNKLFYYLHNSIYWLLL